MNFFFSRGVNWDRVKSRISIFDIGVFGSFGIVALVWRSLAGVWYEVVWVVQEYLWRVGWKIVWVRWVNGSEIRTGIFE